MYMGGLHPRLKSPVAKRLAQAYYNLAMGGTGALTGPTIAGCRVAASGPGPGLLLRPRPRRWSRRALAPGPPLLP